MSMFTALSGINAAQSEIAATSHNIANANTTGFKSSRVEFADVFSSSPMTVARTAVGSGAQVARIAQQFQQGNIQTTGNVLDLAIEGAGFFAVRTQVGNSNELQFTRNGAFSRDEFGTLVNASGSALLGWPVAQDGSSLSTNAADAAPIVVPPLRGAPVGTRSANLGVRLPTDNANIGQQDAVPPSAAFDPADPETYAYSTPLTMLSDEGDPLNVRAYFVKMDAPDALDPTSTWQMHLTLDGAPLTASTPATTVFSNTGRVQSGGVGVFSVLGNNVTIDLTESTTADASFRVESSNHDGELPSSLYSTDIDPTGTVYATYANGESVALGKIFLTNFSNPQGMRQMGATALAPSGTSGDPILGVPGETGFGRLRSGALERSNVELTQELVNLISAQRNYQASAKALETSSSLSQTIIQMR